MPQLCEACTRLKLPRSDFITPPFEPEGRYKSQVHAGTFGALRSTSAACDFCRLIAFAIERSDKDAFSKAEDGDIWSLLWYQSTNDYVPTDEYDEEVGDVQDLFQSALFPSFGGRGDYGIQLVDEKETAGFLRGRLVDAEIDVVMVRGWIERCERSHGKQCETGPLIVELRVFDVQAMCLVTLPAGEKYIALSYIWGQSNFVVTSMENEKTFENPGGLDIALPQTIRDAVDVTKALGLRYLWVDSLCITQDDIERKQALIDNMETVYSNATITLVAATGKGADSGLSGWSKRGREQPCMEFSQDLRLGVLPYYQRELFECEHTQRAWTYQETTLSPRCLVFLKGYVYFNCNAALYCEHTNAEVDGIQPENSASTLGKPDREVTISSALQRYASHVLAYTSRNLTYQSDALNAFRGIAASMGMGQTIFGMPALCFDWAVMWRGANTTLKRRHAFPSWSWVEWRGFIEMPALNDDNYEQMWLLKGTWVDWYTVGPDGVCQPIWDSTAEGEVISPRIEEAEREGWVGPKSPEEREAEDEDDGGQEEAVYEENRAYPSYGHSKLSNFYGRMVDWRFLSPLEPPVLTHNVVMSCSETGPGVLCFRAPTISLTIGPINKSGHNAFNASMLDRTDQMCGFLTLPNDRPFEQGTLVKLLIPSVTSWGDLSSYRTAGLTAPIYDAHEISEREKALGEYLETLPYQMNYDFLNVIYVVEVGKTADIVVNGEKKKTEILERAGVGFVLRESLSDSGQIPWIDVVLV